MFRNAADLNVNFLGTGVFSSGSPIMYPGKLVFAQPTYRKSEVS